MSSTIQTPATRRRGQTLKRSYVACIPCRTRKVKCVIDSEPPCAKCKREHRDCRFDIHERSWKHRETPKWAGRHTDNVPRRTNVEQLQQALPPIASPLSSTTTSPVVIGDSTSPSTQNSIATLRTTASERNQDDATNSASPSFTDRVVSSIVRGPSDALDILFDAASARQGISLQPLDSPTFPRLEFTTHSTPVISQLSRPQDQILDLWDKCRFVRQGWFTAQEAVTYVDLFYQYFAPLSPVVVELYGAHSKHTTLLREEPMLCCTILLIASRYFVLPGAGGHSRSHFIHQRLWQYSELLIRRVICGQEKYSTAKTRVLGTIESLLLISDWHPRSIHFPTETEGWDSSLIWSEYDPSNRVQYNDEACLDRWREDVFEPSKRAERMSWMLMGCAVNLAYELGVFAEKSSTNKTNQFNNEIRLSRLRRLLYIYVTQMANRFGCGSLLPDSISSTSLTTLAESSSSDDWETYIGLGTSLTRLTKAASAMFFPSPEHTKQMVLNGQYAILLEHFSPSLEKWWDDFILRSEDLSDPLSQFLEVEFCYLKAYTNALSIQAVVEQALTRGIRTIVDCRNGSLKDCFRANDTTFVREVLSACNRILESTIKLASRGFLRYAPSKITTYITCSSVLLLKAAFVCRAAHVLMERTGWQDHFQTLEKAISALRSSIIDDMDLACRYATLLEKQLAKLHACFGFEGCSGSSQGQHIDTTGMHNQQQLSQALNFSQSSDTASNEAMNSTEYSTTLDDSWWTLPFDPSLAPFTSSDEPPFSLGFQADSLDFLWNLTDINIGG